MNDPSKAASIRYSGQWNLSNAATLISGLGGDETNAECAARCEDPVKGRPLSSQKNPPLDLTLQVKLGVQRPLHLAMQESKYLVNRLASKKALSRSGVILQSYRG